MRKLVAVEFLSVDGVMQGLGSPDEDRDGGFEHGGWGAPYGDVLHEVVDPAGLGATSAYLFGRRTYEKMAAFWPFQSDDNPMAASLNSLPKYVATRTHPVLDWKGSEPLLGDLTDAVPRLTSEGSGDVVILGSGEVVRLPDEWPASSTSCGCSSIRCCLARASGCWATCRRREHCGSRASARLARAQSP